jgi:hypothetical protein
MEKPSVNPYATPEQLAYATWLDWGMKIGFTILVISFLLYVFSLIESHVPVADLPRYWTLPVNEYLTAVNVDTGWSWLALVNRSDFMNFVGIAFLSAVTIVCYLRILPILFKNKDIIYSILAVLEVLVLVLAASGILVSGGH